MKIKTKGTWDSITQNSDGLVKLNILLPATEIAQSVEFFGLVEELCQMTVTPEGVDGVSPLVFKNLDFFNLNLKATTGDVKVTFRTVKEEMEEFSFKDLNKLVDALVTIEVETTEQS